MWRLTKWVDDVHRFLAKVITSSADLTVTGVEATTRVTVAFFGAVTTILKSLDGVVFRFVIVGFSVIGAIALMSQHDPKLTGAILGKFGIELTRETDSVDAGATHSPTSGLATDKKRPISAASSKPTAPKATAPAAPKRATPQIERAPARVVDALSILPKSRRDNVGVVMFDGHGARSVLRDGNSPYWCVADNPEIDGYFAGCLPGHDLALLARYEQLGDLPQSDRIRQINEEIDERRLPLPVKSASYFRVGRNRDSARNVTLIPLPYAVDSQPPSPLIPQGNEQLVFSGTVLARWVILGSN